MVESEKKKLVDKYNKLSNGIISKHDYEKDIEIARKELEELKKTNINNQKYLEG